MEAPPWKPLYDSFMAAIERAERDSTIKISGIGRRQLFNALRTLANRKPICVRCRHSRATEGAVTELGIMNVHARTCALDLSEDSCQGVFELVEFPEEYPDESGGQ